MTLKSLFSFQGRFSRSQFWLWGFGLPALVGVSCGGLISALMLPSADPDGLVGIFIALGLLYLPLTFVGVACSVKRLHDLGRSGWWYLLTLIPLINVGFVIWIGAIKGFNGLNHYGQDPLRDTTNKVTHNPVRWVLVGVSGQYKGCDFPLDEDLVFGTDSKNCNVVIDADKYPTFGAIRNMLRLHDSARIPRLYFHNPRLAVDGAKGLDWQEQEIRNHKVDLGLGLVFQLRN